MYLKCKLVKGDEQLAGFGATIQIMRNSATNGANSACISIFQVAQHLTLSGILLCARLHNDCLHTFISLPRSQDSSEQWKF